MTQPMRLLEAIFLCSMLLVSNFSFAYQSPVDTPAVASKFAASSPLLAVARVGKRLVAVGLRGHIVYSNDEGKSWTQAQVPVSSDLVALSFPTAQQGWAAGHDGVVLHTSDGGETWTKQLDSRQAAEMTARYYAAAKSSAPSADVDRAARQAKALVDGGDTQSLLDIRFDSENSGFAVGTFNRIFRTEDGGKTWTPWMDRTDNPQELHFYAIASDGRDTYLTGERGMVWRLDPALQRFIAIPTSYTGTLFGLVADGSELLAYGMRGSLLHSGNGGKSWEKLSLGTAAGITGGVVLSDGRIAIVTQAGEIRVSSDHGQTFKAWKAAQSMPYYGVAVAMQGKVAVVGPNGVRVETLP